MAQSNYGDNSGIGAILAIMQGMGSNKTGRVQQGELNPIYELLLSRMMGGQFALPVDDDAMLREHAPNVYAIASSESLTPDSIEQKILSWVREGKTPREVDVLVSEELGSTGQDNDPKSANVKSLTNLTDTLFKELNITNSKIADAQKTRAANDPYTKQGIRSPDNYQRTEVADLQASIAPYLAKLQQQYAPYQDSTNIPEIPKVDNSKRNLAQDKQAWLSLLGGIPGLTATRAVQALTNQFRGKPEAPQATATGQKSAEQQAHDVKVLAI